MGGHQKARNYEREESSVSTSAGTESRALSGVHQRTGNRIRAGEAGGGVGGGAQGRGLQQCGTACRVGAELGLRWGSSGSCGELLGSGSWGAARGKAELVWKEIR